MKLEDLIKILLINLHEGCPFKEMAQGDAYDLELAYAMYTEWAKNNPILPGDEYYQIQFMFSGGGDSGDVEEFGLYRVDPEKRKSSTPYQYGSTLVPFPELSIVADVEYTIRDIVVEKYLNEYDWWNNDGGWGEGTITLHTQELNVDYHIRLCTEEHYNHKVNLSEDDTI